MLSRLLRYSTRLVALCALASLVACGGCDDGGGSGNSGDRLDVGVDQGTGSDTGRDSGSPSDGGADDGTGGDVNACPLLLTCGDGCCGFDEECVDDACVPACAGQRCGDDQLLCCVGADVCLGTQCLEPGADCRVSEDCDIDDFCEPTLGKCVPRDAVEVCEYRPPIGEFTPELKCRWTPNPGDPLQNDAHVVATPVVINLTDDNGDGVTNTDDVPDVVFLTYDLSTACCAVDASLRIVSGDCNADGTMTTIATIHDLPLDNSAGIAVGDINNDGVPEIVAITRRPYGTVAYERVTDDGSQWRQMWHNEQYPSNQHTRGGATIGLADLDNDGNPEVIIGNVVLNGVDGTLKWDGRQTVGTDAGIGNNGFLGPSSAVGDINLDGKLEVAAGNTLYDHQGNELWTFDYGSGANSNCGGNLPCDGFTAMANFDDDPEGEVVIIRRGEVFILEHTGELLWRWAIPTDDCANNESGPPTIADFDGDGKPEIGTAAADFYTVLDMACDADPLPAGCQERGVLWAVPNQDCSSRVTASSVFDFEGDGKAEMVYADERTFRIFDGTTGAILYDDPTHGSHTRIEMPIVVDVDNDGNSEVLIPENGSNGGQPGLDVWGDAADNWVRTRRVWNQHAYHVTNIEEDGTIPQFETPNWSNPRLNNFRQNVQPSGVFDAPNLQVASLTARGTGCGDSQEVVIRATVTNAGALGVPAGVPVRIYARSTSGGAATVILDTVTTTRLLPGQRELFEVLWTVPPDLIASGYEIGAIVDPDAQVNECVEDDNEQTLDGADIMFAVPDLVVAEVTASGTTCGTTGEMALTVTVRNDGTQPVPANVPIDVVATFRSTTVDVATLQSTALAPNESHTFNLTWTAASGAYATDVTFTATVDPDGEVYACDEKSTASVTEHCRVQM